ncbi:tetratricopeptide repeat protein [Pseudoxanthomonas winnipegensis]|uniref:Sel1 repeat family protein n=1 Tax=Pseudoxanthomonas winnipegensis TaxID=2480810 RepID=A0A4Q8L5A6_9GAMM|nr:tetratricopeptide repeat protein [Pseudoxanthomonas winnipegensis]TAA21586.1 sel1 repeat family protein [Pseudoxanthomonas winnipegensis]
MYDALGRELLADRPRPMCTNTMTTKLKKSVGPYERAEREMSQAKPSLEKAYSYLIEAQSNFDPRADYALATWYLHGRFVRRNVRKSIRLLKSACDGKVPEACFDIAVLYETGVGVKKNPRRAAIYYLKAALLGEKSAANEVARCLYYGIGFSKDVVQARVWRASMSK